MGGDVGQMTLAYSSGFPCRYQTYSCSGMETKPSAGKGALLTCERLKVLCSIKEQTNKQLEIFMFLKFTLSQFCLSVNMLQNCQIAHFHCENYMACELYAIKTNNKKVPFN